MDKKLAIISVIYENYDILKDFFGSFEDQKNKNFHLFIADLSKYKKPVKTHLPLTIIFGENKGYAHGVNLAIEKARAEGYENFCVMNDDTFFKSNFVENILKSLERHSHSIIGGKIYYAAGYEYHKDRYEKKELGKVLWYAGGTFDWDHALTPHRGVDEIDMGQYDNFEETQFVNGALMCFDKQVYTNLGGWDESYFLYYEDSDYCMKASHKGIKIYYDPSIVIWHKVSQSTDGSGSELHQKYQEKNRLRFGLKYAPLKTKFHLAKNYIIKRLRLFIS